jgi:hypothetical protein
MWGGQGPYKDCSATDEDDDEVYTITAFLIDVTDILKQI